MKNILLVLLFALVLINSCLVFATPYMQEDASPPIVLTKEEDIKLIKTLMEASKKILIDREACLEKAKDAKQECYCDKKAQYDDLAKMIDDILLQEERRNWFDSRLSFEENGQIVKTSIAYHQELAAAPDGVCLPNENGSLKANHEFDKPELTITDEEDAKTLLFLLKQKGKILFQYSSCSTSAVHSRKQCSCSYKLKLEELLTTVHASIKKQPEWIDRVLVIPQKGYKTKISFEQDIREINEAMKDCKK